MSKHRIDTRKDNPYQIGADLIELVGGFDPKNYTSINEAADDVEEFLKSHGLKLTDYDGERRSIAHYVRRYLED